MTESNRTSNPMDNSDQPIETVGQFYERLLRKERAEVERLTAELAEARKLLKGYADGDTLIEAERDRLAAELETLKAVSRGAIQAARGEFAPDPRAPVETTECINCGGTGGAHTTKCWLNR